MDLDLFDYDLPKELIAQSKSDPRDMSRLFFIYSREGKNIHEHLRFREIADKLENGDILVLNRSRVIPARILARKTTGGRSEVLLLERSGRFEWEALVAGKNITTGSFLISGDKNVRIEISNRLKEGRSLVRFHGRGGMMDHESVLLWLKENGLMPTPPYIRRMLSDPEEYQTVYGDMEGSIAAPTAGLHFTDDLLKKIERKGVKVVYIVLHVGLGTFAPVKSEDIHDHEMEEEEYFVPEEVSAIIREAVRLYKMTGKRRIWAVGTTVMRTLESAFDEEGDLVSGSGRTDLYITPGYSFKLPYKGFVTNFHLPRSTPLMLVSAFNDREKILHAYREAIEIGYRFYSLGDSMMIRRD
jgi:S-adenosylmethionine:tRNA ribosyltransferase-isomerase